jgi:hypothetical protein
MPTVELTSEEKNILLETLERADHNLRVEIVNTDKREFRRELKQREAVMETLLNRLRSTVN